MPSLWRRRVPAPHLEHSILPPFEIPDLLVVGGVRVENRGQAAAHHIKLTLAFPESGPAVFHHLQVTGDGDPILCGGGEFSAFATVRARALGPGEGLTIYFTTSDSTRPRVTLSHYEG